MPNPRWALVAILCSPLACGDASERSAEENLALWQERGPASYAYIIKRSCFCPNVGLSRAVVTEGAVTSATAIPSGDATTGDTMTQLLEDAVRMASEHRDSFEAEYDAELGYLKYLSSDIDRQAIDDGITLTVSCLAEGTSDEVCPGT